MTKFNVNKFKVFIISHLLKLFHRLPDGPKLFLRSFKAQEPELYEIGWLVEKNTIAVDIGANKGAFTYALSRKIGKNGLVVAIEPIAELAAYIAHACHQLRLPVKVEQCCLSDHDGDGYLFIPIEDNQLQTGLATLDKNTSPRGQQRQIKTKRLDDLLRSRKKRISFIKCDVEGHELKVFQGALDILKSDRPNILVEIEQRHCDEPMLSRFEFFQNNGYMGYFLSFADGVKKLQKVDLDMLIPSSASDQTIIFHNVHNFIFLPEESGNIMHGDSSG